MPTSKFDFFVMIVKDMQYFYIDYYVFVVQGLEYEVKRTYAYFDSCLDVFSIKRNEGFKCNRTKRD